MSQRKTTETESRSTARFNLRTRPHVKALIQHAAALTGVDDTTFIMQAAYDAAVESIERYERIILSNTDAVTMLAAIENPPPATETMREVMRDYRERVTVIDKEW